MAKYNTDNSGLVYSDEMVAQLKKLAKEGLSYNQIARKMKRKPASIRHKCWELDIEVTNKQDVSIKNHAGKRKKRFTLKTQKWSVKNMFLYGALFAKDIKLSQFAQKLDVSDRIVQRWVYDGALPNERNRKSIAKILDIPDRILFCDEAILD